MLKMSKSFVVRMVLWSVVMVYLLCDFFVFTGPIRQLFPTDQERLSEAEEKGICARVHGGPIYLGQVNRRLQENLWRAGRKVEEVSAKEMKLLRWVALNELIDEHILRIKARVNRNDYPVDEAAIDAEVARFETRFAESGDLDRALVTQGIDSREELRYRLAARLQQEKYMQKQIAKAIAVSEQEARQWYDDHQEELMIPEQRRVRHIFLPTLDHPSAEAKARLQEHLASILGAKSDFAKVANDVSEDERSKQHGGDLGWMRRDRLPEDFAQHVFTASIGKPFLFRSKLGWHIAEVTGIKAAELPDYEKIKGEIINDLSNSRKKDAVAEVRRQLRWLERNKVVIYKSVLEREESAK